MGRKKGPRLSRPCRKCSKMFQPEGKFHKVCNDCLANNNYRARWRFKDGEESQIECKPKSKG